MENKINIAELLKDSPKGFELDCVLSEDVILDGIDMSSNYPIKIIIGGKQVEYLSPEGCLSSIHYTNNKKAKCVIFPKGKTTWEGFVPSCKFKNGDIVFYDNCVSIFKEWGDETLFRNYVKVDIDGKHPMLCDRTSCCGKSIKKEARFATEEEKQKLFDAIKDSGYHWNDETKTLEKLIEPKFKGGDVIFKNNFIAIVSHIKSNGVIWYHCWYHIKSKKCKFKKDFGIGSINDIDEIRFATEEEKEKLFDVIKENGYKWNAEIKTLGKLDDTEFKDGDVVFYNDTIAIFKEWCDETLFRTHVTKYLCCDSLIDINVPLFGKSIRKEIRLATEEEKEKLFQAIKDNGYVWNPEIKTLEKLIEPKFKVGDKVQWKEDIREKRIIDNVLNNCYTVQGYGVILFTDQDEWELAPNKFDITNFRDFDKVLMRSSNAREWVATFYSHYNNNKFYGCGMCCDQCIPYEHNEHLRGTTNDCDEYYKTWK